MIYSAKLSSSFNNTAAYSVSGCRKLFLVEASMLSGYTVKNGQVDDISLTGANFNMWDNLEGLSFTVKPETTKSGTAYIVEIGFQIPTLRADVNSLLDKLLNTDTTAIIEDENGRFWLLGYKQGFAASYDAGSEDAGYTVKMSTKQMKKVEEVSYRLMLSLVLNPNANSTVPRPSYSNPPIEGSSGSTAAGNVFKTTLVTANNYQVKITDHLLVVPKSLTVVLPSAPFEGLLHIFKASYDASVAPVTIKSVTASIEGDTQFQINTPEGWVYLQFQGGRWYQVG